MCVRFKQRTPQDAAEQVEYFNGATNTPMGALRSRHGHPEPYRIRYWQIGNEVAGPEYEQRIASFSQAMKAVDPTIKLLIQTDNHRLYKTPTYYAQQLNATLAGNKVLRIESEIPPNAGLDFSDTLSRDGKEVILFAVNDAPEPVTRTLDFSAFGKDSQRLETWTLKDRRQAGEPDATNSFSDPDRIRLFHRLARPASPCSVTRFPASLSLPYAGKYGELELVAPISNRLYRRFVTGRSFASQRCWTI
jgi:alpha-L-arabinofuranosidase